MVNSACSSLLHFCPTAMRRAAAWAQVIFLSCCAFALSRPFTLEDYEAMRADEARTQAFYKAIDELAPGKAVLDLGTGALALLALRAAQRGARRVFAVEVDPSAAACAAEKVRSWPQIQDLELPEPVDLVVHEVLGEIASREGVVSSLAEAERLLRPEAKASPWSVPRRACTWLAPARWPGPRYLQDYRARTGTLLAAPSEGLLRLPNLPVSECLLAEPRIFEDLHWDQEPLLRCQKRSLEFTVTEPGSLAGFVFFITVDCGQGAPLVSSAEVESHWANSLCPVDTPVFVAAGQKIVVETEVNLSGPTYCLEARLPGGQLLVPRTIFQ
ncbi:unnamed protein product [Effrenium voratum]|nr:unnamed protein product [Effrenium voratum]